jgi:riboflavin kinase/FMN adenylyltransferase
VRLVIGFDITEEQPTRQFFDPQRKDMQIEEELSYSACKQDTVLTIGVFDGVHLGHQHLVSHLREEARVRGLSSAVVTFRCHPRDVLSPETRIPCLNTLERRVELLKSLGVELVAVIPFTPEVAHLSARVFIAMLQKYLRMREMVIGPDFALGRGREGDIHLLRSLEEEMGFTVNEVPPMRLNGEVISSTNIRSTLSEGDIQKANKLLGRNFSLAGRVISGTGKSKAFGFPTANLSLAPNQALPGDGVYATKTHHIEDRTYLSATNIGGSFTFGRASAGQNHPQSDSKRTVEAYLIDFNADLLGQEIEVEFIEKLRGEQHFTTADELKTQISIDVERAKAALEDKSRLVA